MAIGDDGLSRVIVPGVADDGVDWVESVAGAALGEVVLGDVVPGIVVLGEVVLGEVELGPVSAGVVDDGCCVVLGCCVGVGSVEVACA